MRDTEGRFTTPDLPGTARLRKSLSYSGTGTSRCWEKYSPSKITLLPGPESLRSHPCCVVGPSVCVTPEGCILGFLFSKGAPFTTIRPPHPPPPLTISTLTHNTHIYLFRGNKAEACPFIWGLALRFAFIIDKIKIYVKSRFLQGFAEFIAVIFYVLELVNWDSSSLLKTLEVNLAGMKTYRNLMLRNIVYILLIVFCN